MSVEQGFLEQLAAHPEDDTTRLVYADWLEERGDPRAEHLRLEVELAGLDEEGPRHPEVENRLRELRKLVIPSWVEQTGKRYDVVLHGYEPSAKIATIKVAREMTGMGLFEAKCLCETLPGCLATARPRHAAEVWRDRYTSSLKDRVAVELAPTVHSRPIYGLAVSGYFENHRPAVAKRLVQLRGVSEEEAAVLASGTQVLLRAGLTLAEALGEGRQVAPDVYVPLVVCRMEPPHLSPFPIPYHGEGWCRVELRGYEPRDEPFVLRTLQRVWGCSTEEVEQRLVSLPLVIEEAVDGLQARWTWQRFRGRAEVRLVSLPEN